MNFPVQSPDLQGLPDISRSDVQIFVSDQLSQGWQTWIKPRGVTMCYMIAIAGGGGGSGGNAAASGARTGGGGGACSGIVRMLYPAFFLPNELYVMVGAGGNGGASNTAATAGSNSFIAYGHSTSMPNCLLSSGGLAPGGGVVAGTGGTVPTLYTGVSTTQQSGLTAWQTVGIVGAAGGSGNAAGTSVTAWAALPLSPGAGGGGTNTVDQVGGGQTATAAVDWGFRNWPNTAGFLAPGGAAGTNNGNPGVVSWAPFFMSGGAGGGSSSAGTGGAGGRGGIGCGGGGGGAGVTGGQGGNGGDGLVMIISW